MKKHIKGSEGLTLEEIAKELHELADNTLWHCGEIKRNRNYKQPNETIKEIMKLRGFTNQSLATRLGKSTASAVANPLSKKNVMRIDTFLKMVSAMDCEVIVRTLDGKTEWVMKEDWKD